MIHVYMMCITIGCLPLYTVNSISPCDIDPDLIVDVMVSINSIWEFTR